MYYIMHIHVCVHVSYIFKTMHSHSDTKIQVMNMYITELQQCFLENAFLPFCFSFESFLLPPVSTFLLLPLLPFTAMTPFLLLALP